MILDRCPTCPVPPDRPCAAVATNCRRLCELAATDPAYRDHVVAISADLPPPPSRGRNVSGRVIEAERFLTTAQLAADGAILAQFVPPDVDLVVGVARSGLVPGAILATHLHRPLWAVSHLGGVVDVSHGNRLMGDDAAEPRHVLLVDDTVALGGTMAGVEPKVRARWPEATLTRCVVYAHPNGQHAVDLFWAEYPGEHWLEWNWQNAGHGQRCGYDFDGILCVDHDGSYPLDAIPPLYLPRRLPVPLIATGRGGECRAASEAWLRRHGVRWDRLEMRPDHVPWDMDAIARWKADVYASSGLPLYAESDPRQAEIIHDLTGLAVLCPALGRVLPARVEAAGEDLARVFACPHRSCKRCGAVDCVGGKRAGQRVRLDDCVACLAEAAE